jgi:hypothetical protein
MKPGTRLAVALAVVLVAAPAATAAPDVTVTVDRTAVETKLGHSFSFRSTVTNRGERPTTGLIAHLNVVSLRGDVYVDPEDWSSHRTRYLPPIPPGGSTTLAWTLSAVNAGRLGVYVAVLPRDGNAVAPTTGPTVAVTIADRQTLDAGGIVPLALGIPALLGVLAVSVRLGRGRPQRAAAHAGRGR